MNYQESIQRNIRRGLTLIMNRQQSLIKISPVPKNPPDLNMCVFGFKKSAGNVYLLSELMQNEIMANDLHACY